MNIYPKAFLFDLNGTMIDDMGYHAVAWHDILNNTLHAAMSMDQVRKQMYGKNEEVLERIFGKNHFSPQQLQDISFQKERSYQRAYLPNLRLIGGLGAFLEKASTQRVSMAVCTAAIPFNIDFVLDNLHIRHFFKTIVSADDVVLSKPDPEVFSKAAGLLQVDAADCLVFEDAPKGVEAAERAGMPSVAITTTHQREEFNYLHNIKAFITDYTDPALEKFFPV